VSPPFFPRFCVSPTLLTAPSRTPPSCLSCGGFLFLSFREDGSTFWYFQDTNPHFASSPPHGAGPAGRNAAHPLGVPSHTTRVGRREHGQVHHAFGSATLSLMHTAAEPSGDDTTWRMAGQCRCHRMLLVVHLIIPSLVHTGLSMAVFPLMIPSGALVVRYTKLTSSFAAFDPHHNLHSGVGAFAFGPLYLDLPLILFFGQSLPSSHGLRLIRPSPPIEPSLPHHSVI